MATVFAPQIKSPAPQNRLIPNEPSSISPLRSFLQKYFYFLLALLCVAIKVGFSLHTPALFVHEVHHDNAFHPEKGRPLILWAHNFVIGAWLLFVVFQTGLVHIRKIRWHRFSGWFGGALGIALTLVGIATAIVKGRAGIAEHMGIEAEAYLVVPFFNMFAFCVIATLAVIWRKRLEMHRTLIFIATCTLLDTAFSRSGLVFSYHLFYVCIDLLILFGALLGLYTFRRLQRVYLVALPALAMAQAFVYYTWEYASGWSVNIARAIIG